MHYYRTCVTVMALSLLSVAAADLRAVEIIAHRGASHDAPENTVAAFRLGWEQNADAVELDIHLTKDGQIVAIHDADTHRTTGVRSEVADCTLQQLRELDAGSWKGSAWKGEKLPTLRESLAAIPDGKRVFIEIKCKEEILPALQRDLAASAAKPGQLVLIGFDLPTMERAKKLFPELPVYWLAGYKADKKTQEYPKLDDLIRKARAAGMDGLNLDFKFPIDAEFVAQVKAAGLALYVWTVDDAAIARCLAAAGVAGITTNRPAWLREKLKQ